MIFLLQQVRENGTTSYERVDLPFPHDPDYAGEPAPCVPVVSEPAPESDATEEQAS